MVDTQVECWRMEDTWDRVHHHVDVDTTSPSNHCSDACSCRLVGEFLRHSACYHPLSHTCSHGVKHPVVGIVSNLLREIAVHILIKVDRCRRLQPLVRPESAEGPMPLTIIFALNRQLLRHRVTQLTLRKVHEVLWTIVYIHEHVVA